MDGEGPGSPEGEAAEDTEQDTVVDENVRPKRAKTERWNVGVYTCKEGFGPGRPSPVKVQLELLPFGRVPAYFMVYFKASVEKRFNIFYCGLLSTIYLLIPYGPFHCYDVPNNA